MANKKTIYYIIAIILIILIILSNYKPPIMGGTRRKIGCNINSNLYPILNLFVLGKC